ncbi:MAG: hypothetical protein U9Q69_00330 [Nanoarchaeota archaeon]|nr:hypothetical protein [Nanoarchaeota archaeon]
MKKILILLFIILLSFPALSQEDYILEKSEIAEVVENNLPVEFHAVSGTEEVNINLPKYFGKDADFVYSQTEYVKVQLDPITHIAKLSAKDPNWRGTETIIFATSIENLIAKKTSILLPLRFNVTKVMINVTKDQIASRTDAFTQQQFNTIIGNLTSEPIDITTFLQNLSLGISINNELFFNISLDEKNPNYNMAWKLQRNKTMRAGEYKESSDIITFTVFIIFILAIAILLMYLYYGYFDTFKGVMFKPKKQRTKLDDKIKKYRNIAYSELTALEKNIGKNKNRKIYRAASSAMNSFLTKALGVRGSNINKINENLTKKQLPRGIISRINYYISDTKTKVYSKKELTDQEVASYISSLKSLIKRL